MPIEYPVRDERGAAFRRVVEMAAQATPVTAALAHLYGYTHPSEFERALEQFHRDIAATVNGHEERITRLEAALAPRALVSSLALDVAFHILQTNNTGRLDSLVFDELCAAFATTDVKVLEEAVAELAHLGYADTTAAFGVAIRAVRPTTAMFLAFDLAATGRDTRADAIKIGQLWLTEELTHNVFELIKRLEWDPRRLNPALAALRHVFPDGRWSRENHPTLKTTSVLVTPEERFKLRSIVESGRVD